MEKITWVTEKPEINEECILLIANSYTTYWEYSVFHVEKFIDDNVYYWGLVDSLGDEWGPIEDLHADKYAIIEPLN